jgi:molybdate transport system ATP-binding protein
MTLRLENIVLKLPSVTLRLDAALAGPVTGLCGPSGAGKTTLLEMIAGLRRPDAGRILLDDQVLTDGRSGPHLPPEKRGIGYVPQDLGLFPHLNAGTNLLFGFRPGAHEAHLPDRVIEVLKLCGLLPRSIAQLSGGEKQRIAIGRALLARPRLLLLDEPLTGLDDELKERVLELVRTVVEEFHVPVVYVSHTLAELAVLGGDVLALREGELRRQEV